MRRTLLGGLLLVAAAFFTVLVGGWLDLELDAVAVLGVGAGAVVALVPDATAGRRLAGFALGVVAAVLGYYVRAALTPDTSMGRAVFAALVVALCVVVAAASVGRLPLWSALLGAGTFAGSFESTYSSAVPRVVDLSIGALTTLAVCVAVGFVAAALAGASRPERRSEHRADGTDHADHSSTDEQMEPAK
jgi:hypothetical protein